MVEIRNGATKKPSTAKSLAELFAREKANLDGVLYIGYPVFYVAGESVAIDALWVSPSKGVVVFDLVESPELDNRDVERDELYGKVESQLVVVPELKDRRKLAVPIEVFTFSPAYKGEVNQNDTFSDADELIGRLQSIENWESGDRFKPLLAQIQSTLKLRASKKRSYVKREDSKGAIVRDFEATIANLDQKQEQAVIDSVEGVQRIRGLAGSGKTVILALKAAYFHAQHPDWDIGVTFHTRSLKQQFVSLIKRFCIEKIGQEPDWDKIKILNSWGSPSSPGVYSELCRVNGTKYRDFGLAKRMPNPFDYVCTKLQEESGGSLKEVYDVLLLDEAQDLPITFLNLCYASLRAPKRLVYAYDELQKLNEGQALPAPEEIFGKEADDIILRCCYRNPRPVLVTAHAAGLGIYRDAGMVQFFNNPKLWSEVGYEVENGALKQKSKVSLYRPSDTSPNFFEERVQYKELVHTEVFDSDAKQTDWIVSSIEKNIKEDELLPSDILVISPDALTMKNATSAIRYRLMEKGIKNHITGEANADVFSRDDSVAFSGIYRAKGNEAAMVYLLNSQHCYEAADGSPGNLIKKRNTLFTAITRSKAWVNVCGVGSRMEKLSEELKRISQNEYHLNFLYPTGEEIEQMNVIHRDISKKEKKRIDDSKGLIQKISEIRESIESGETYPSDYPKEIIEMLEKLYT